LKKCLKKLNYVHLKIRIPIMVDCIIFFNAYGNSNLFMVILKYHQGIKAEFIFWRRLSGEKPKNLLNAI